MNFADIRLAGSAHPDVDGTILKMVRVGLSTPIP